MMGQEYWEQFMTSGKVDDYLYYKGMEICEQVLEKYDRIHESGQAGGNSESVYYGNGNGTFSSTDW